MQRRTFIGNAIKTIVISEAAMSLQRLARAQSQGQLQAATGFRRPWQQPGANNSVWNLPIGTGAIWSKPTDADTRSLLSAINTVNAASYGIAVYVGNGSDPVVKFTSTWGAGAQRNPGYSVTLHCPANALPSPPLGYGDRQMVLFDETNPSLIAVFGPCTFNNGQNVLDGVTSDYGEYDNTYGPMEDAATGNYGYDCGLGVIRAYDLQSGRIAHMLRFACLQSQLKNTGGWTREIAWPQTHSDYDQSGYTGSLIPGATIGIPANVGRPSGLSAGGIMLWNALQQFGAMWRDSSGGGITFYAEPDLEGNSLISGMRNDMQAICSHLRVLRNQSAATPNGGGTRIATPPPPIK